MLTYDFMLRAFAASGIVALVAGAVGYFLVLRGQTFAGHALSHVGFAGATGAALVGVAPLWGMLAFTLVAGTGMGLLGERLSGRDVAVGIVLALALGFGLLFLNLNTAHHPAGDRHPVRQRAGGLADDARPGWSSSASRRLPRSPRSAARCSSPASSRSSPRREGVSLRLIGTLFLAVTALAVAQSVQIVGVLLVFTLMVGPPAAAQRLTAASWPGMALACGLALGQAWLGIAIAYYSDWPVSFCITGAQRAGLFRGASPPAAAPELVL